MIKKIFLGFGLVLVLLAVFQVFRRPSFLQGQKSAARAEKPAPLSSKSFDMHSHSDDLSVEAVDETLEQISCVQGLNSVVQVRIYSRYSDIIHSGLEPGPSGERPVNLGHRLRPLERPSPYIEGARNTFATGIIDANGLGEVLDVKVACPTETGTYELQIEFVQEGVAWQSDLQPAGQNIRLQLKSQTLVEKAQNLEPELTPELKKLIEQRRIPSAVRQVSLGAFHLLRESRVEDGRLKGFLLSEAGSQYPMFWVRDLATIQGAFYQSGLGDPKKDRHWTELFLEFRKPRSGIEDWLRLTPALELVDSDKNTVTTDQELWLLISIIEAFEGSHLDVQWLDKKLGRLTVADHLNEILDWLYSNRWAKDQACLWSGHTVDWGDVGPEGQDSSTSTKIEFGSGRICSAFSQALFVQMGLNIQKPRLRAIFHRLNRINRERLENMTVLAGKYLQSLWSESRHHFVMHKHIAVNPELRCKPSDFYALGAQVLAWESGSVSPGQLKLIAGTILRNQKNRAWSTVGVVLFPPYHEGFFHNEIMKPHQYQNGAQWDWFGARGAALIHSVDPVAGEAALLEIAEKVLKNGTFFEWDYPDGRAGEGAHFRAGAAAFLKSAFKIYKPSA